MVDQEQSKEQNSTQNPQPNPQQNQQQNNGNYGAENITVLEGLEAVRKRPGMYIGSTGERGLHHLVYEVVDNSVDEALAGYCDKITVQLLPDGAVSVEDNGRGIPVELHPKEQKSTLEVVLTVLHAGGKFGDGGYSISGGLHGVGISVVNALSTKVNAQIKRDGFEWEMDFEQGKATSELKQGKATTQTGTKITFWADPSVFETTQYDFETLRTRLQQMAFLNRGLTISLEDLREDIVKNEYNDVELDDVELDQELEFADDSNQVYGNENENENDPSQGVGKNNQNTTADQNSTQTQATSQASAQAQTQTQTPTNKAPNKGKKVIYKYENGLVDYVQHINKSKTSEAINDQIITISSTDQDTQMSLDIAMQWTTSYSESIYTFANTINTTEGGMHEEGFRTALTSIVNKFAKSLNVLKEKDENLSGNDVREGLSCVLSIKLVEPQFEGQTKTKLGNTDARTFTQKVIGSQLTDWFDANPDQAKLIASKALQAASARIAARKAREATRRKGLMDSIGMPGKLRDCSSNNPEICEVFLVEGDSAGGSAVRGREPNTQAIMPLRGKILNVEKVRLDKALTNKEIQSMITAFGTSIGDEFNIEKLRYHKIVLMADADVDGQHITTLLLTFLFRYMPKLIEQGFVYLAKPPLYRLKWTNSPHEFSFSDEERDQKLTEGAKNGKKIPKENGVQRYKGLGEMNYDELWDTTMDPEKRILEKVNMESAAQADEIFSMLMGDEVAPRRDFIQRNAKFVRFLDI